MFLHLLIYKFRQILRTRWVLGWTLLFPLILATAFYAGFGSIIKEESAGGMDPVPVALASQDADSPFSQMIRELSKKDAGQDQIFELTAADDQQARALLEDGRVTGIYYDNGEEDPGLTVAETGMNQTMLSEFLKIYINNYTVIKENAEAAAEGAADPRQAGRLAQEMAEKTQQILSEEDAVEPVKFREDPIAPDMQFFFALIAMASLFSSWMSTIFMESISADKSAQGLRFECSPASKFQAVAASAISGIIIQFAANLVLVLYIEHVLGLPFGTPFPFVLLVTTLGGGVGICSGMVISCITGSSESLNVAIPLAFTMICSFLSGLMVSGIRETIELHAPVINRINPAAVLSDALCQAGTYGVDSRYWTDVLILVIMVAVCLVLTSIRLSRRNYDNI